MSAFLHIRMYAIIYLSTQLLSASLFVYTIIYLSTRLFICLHNVYTYSYVFEYLSDYLLLQFTFTGIVATMNYTLPLLYIFACTASYQSFAGILDHTRHCLLALLFPEIYF